jgi:LTXXQ motif family protein
MKKFLVVGTVAALLTGTLFVYGAQAEGDATPAEHSGQWAEVRAALLDARLAGFKAGLKLTAEQERNWPAFESAFRAIAKNRAEGFQEMRERRADGMGWASPVDRLRFMSDRLAKRSADLKMLADATAPFYASLDDEQKRLFVPLSRQFLRGERHEHWRHQRD